MWEGPATGPSGATVAGGAGGWTDCCNEKYIYIINIVHVNHVVLPYVYTLMSYDCTLFCTLTIN